MHISIEFFDSSSAEFPGVLAAAKALEGYEDTDLGNKRHLYRVTVGPDRFRELVPLAGRMSGWRNKRVVLNGEEVPWGSVFGFVSCLKKRSGSYDKDRYCMTRDGLEGFNLFGCIGAVNPMDPPANWWASGRFEDENGRWTVDRAGIFKYLQQLLHERRMCPALSWQRIAAILQSMPNRIDPWVEDDWDFVDREWDGNPQSLIKNPRTGEIFPATSVWPATYRPLESFIARIRELDPSYPDVDLRTWVRLSSETVRPRYNL